MDNLKREKKNEKNFHCDDKALKKKLNIRYFDSRMKIRQPEEL